MNPLHGIANIFRNPSAAAGEKLDDATADIAPAIAVVAPVVEDRPVVAKIDADFLEAKARVIGHFHDLDVFGRSF